MLIVFRHRRKYYCNDNASLLRKKNGAVKSKKKIRNLARDKKMMSGQHSSRRVVGGGRNGKERGGCRDTQEDWSFQQASKEFMNSHPHSALWSKGRAVCISYPSTSIPGGLAAGLSSAAPWAHSVPRVPDPRRAGPPPPVPLASARIICSAAQLPAAAAALPGAGKAGIRCYHNKLNCSQQGPGK